MELNDGSASHPGRPSGSVRNPLPQFHWTCSHILSAQRSLARESTTTASESSKGPALIVLNQPIINKVLFEQVWGLARTGWKLCADGGANRLLDAFGPDSPRGSVIPDTIKGDLDSLRKDVREYYEGKGVTILQDGDQYSTDFQKCLAEVERLEQDSNLPYKVPVVVMGGLSGRLDQTTHVLSVLQKARLRRDTASSAGNESGDARQGEHVIEIDHAVFGETCGILPLGVETAHVKTKGLKWDFEWDTSLETDVSTSNHLLPEQPHVRIETDRPVWWTMEIKEELLG